MFDRCEGGPGGAYPKLSDGGVRHGGVGGRCLRRWNEGRHCAQGGEVAAGKKEAGEAERHTKGMRE